MTPLMAAKLVRKPVQTLAAVHSMADALGRRDASWCTTVACEREADRKYTQ